MATNRNEFSPGVKSILAHRAGYRCSKPDCRALTVGPNDELQEAYTNIGVAAHITAASPGGPRYDPTLSSVDRASVSNGIWMCQNHGKEIDDDTTRFTVDTLRAWKDHAENDARALLGRPISAQSLDITIQIAVHRARDNSLCVTGTTNLPSGTKLWVEFHDPRTQFLLGQSETCVVEGLFAAGGFTQQGRPYPHAWYIVKVLAYFNGPWRQLEAVMQIVGREGQYLVGQFAEPLHPEFEESEKRLHAAFAAIAPRLSGAPERNEADVQEGIALVQNSILTVDGGSRPCPFEKLSICSWRHRGFVRPMAGLGSQK